MPVPVLYPKVSLEEVSGRISRWLVAEGASVNAGDVLFEIENDKAAVEVEAPASGILRDLVAEGETVDVGANVAAIYQPGEAAAPVPAPVPVPAAAPAALAVTAPQSAAPLAPVAVSASRGPNPTPLARRIAQENGVSLAGLTGSGPRGRVQKSDVMAQLAAVARGASLPQAAASSSTGTAGSAQAAAAVGDLNAVWLRRGQGMPLVLLHGFSADLNNWRGLFAGAQAPCPVLALDLPAHGGSPAALPRDLDALAAVIEATLDNLGVEACTLVGHSFGAAAAARIATRGRLDIRALGLISPAGLDPEINQAFTSGILRARTAASLKPWLELLVHEPQIISPAFLRAVETARQDEALTAAMTDFAAQFFADGTQTFSIRQDLAALRLPVRVIFGRQDRILPFRSTRALPGHVGLHAFDHCGHMPHLEHPAAVLALLSELMRCAQ